MAGVIGQAYYKASSKDSISPSSSTMIMGMYSTSKTFMAFALQQLYLKEDRWRIKFAIGLGNIYFQYYQGLPEIGGAYGQVEEDGVWINFETVSKFMVLDAKRRVFKDFYVGALFTANWANTEYDFIDPSTGENIITNANMISLGYSLLYDSRDHVNLSTKGFFIHFKNSYVREAFGSSSNFDKIELAANYFWDIKKNAKSILVSRIYTDIAYGDVPFQGENVVGRDDLRGYSEGRYRGNQVYAIQAELRQNIYKRFGMIGFLGFGTATEKFTEIPNSVFLPSAGLGVRYLMIPKEKINIGIDVGVGKDDWSLAFRIGETFGR